MALCFCSIYLVKCCRFSVAFDAATILTSVVTLQLSTATDQCITISAIISVILLSEKNSLYL